MKNDPLQHVMTKLGTDSSQPCAQTGQPLALSALLTQLLNQIMLSERELFLQKADSDKGNGFYDRGLATPLGNLELAVPRSRSGEFRPNVLPDHYQRVHASYTDLLNALVVNGYSDSFLDSFFRSLGLPYSRTELDKIRQDLLTQLEDFKTRELPPELFALFIDGYITQVKWKGRVKRTCLYVLAGVDLEGNKSPLGFFTMPGAESKEQWLQVFNDLIGRGLKRVMLVISDDVPGLSPVVTSLFPNADHQLCLVHLERNTYRHMARADARAFNQAIHKLRFSDFTFDTALAEFEDLADSLKDKYPSFMDYVRPKAKNYLAFFKFPFDIRRYIYTTNLVENLNLQIDRIKTRLGGYFQSQEILEINVYLQFLRLLSGRWQKPIPMVRCYRHELLQLFRLRFPQL